MFDERAFIARVEAADTDELAAILTHPTAAEEKALRSHLGEDRYRRMHGMSLRRSVKRGALKKGNVVVIHGIMGAELSSIGSSGTGTNIWVNLFQIMKGSVSRLRLAEDGVTGYEGGDVRASGIMKRFYGELLLSLSDDWNVRAYWYDWRKSLDLAADDLKNSIEAWFPASSPVHIVAHSMGGLVARTFIKNHPKLWDRMLDKGASGACGGRLIMLGTPNHGSFSIPQVITGVEETVRKLATVDLRHSLRELLATFNSFPGSYQMLPSSIEMPAMEKLYQYQTYGDLNVSQVHLDNARKHHDLLRDVVDPKRMVYIAGYNQPTFSDITDWKKLLSPRPKEAYEAYGVTRLGDGRVTHQLGLLKNVTTYYVEENHGDLSANEQVFAAVRELLATGKTTELPDRFDAKQTRQAGADQKADRAQLVGEIEAERLRLEMAATRLKTRGVDPQTEPVVNTEERKLEETITRGFLASGEDHAAGVERELAFEPAQVELRLVQASIATIGTTPGSRPAIDAIAVGHYLGVKPQAAELALDKAISRPLADKATLSRGEHGAGLRESDLILTQYTERGTIRGNLGHAFLLPDPRVENARGSGRIIAVAGMGAPGRFGVPELRVLARELCWSLGRIGRQHLATVIVGSGNGNIPVEDAMRAWIGGIKNALTGSIESEGRQLRCITFVEVDGAKIRDIQRVILDEQAQLRKKKRLMISYRPYSEAELEEFETAAAKDEASKAAIPRRKVIDPEKVAPTRLTLALERRLIALEESAAAATGVPGAVAPAPTALREEAIYKFGAITENASMPEREVVINGLLVEQANNEMAAEWKPEMQVQRGLFMEQLLIPSDLRPHLAGNAPLVLMLDSSTARIHWEIMAQASAFTTGDPSSAPSGGQLVDGAPPFELDERPEGAFFGLSRGLTRQLRATFAPPPEPPPPPRRILRVLVVADPAEDAHLPGAEEEGVVVADLFDAFNKVYEDLSDNRVEVVRLFGPRDASWTNVLREVMIHSYDVLHYAGHCFYNPRDPKSSGWIFNLARREFITANELKRVDRIPKFIFSNACESGITPDRSERRSVDLAPSFAEAFFSRGVANFVCTAWPVDDVAAREFAVSLYSGLLGLEKGPGEGEYRAVRPKSMHIAMRDARNAIANQAYGVRTWGAYQHYGTPYFKFFDPESMNQRSGPAGARAVRVGARGKVTGGTKAAAGEARPRTSAASGQKSPAKASSKKSVDVARKESTNGTGRKTAATTAGTSRAGRNGATPKNGARAGGSRPKGAAGKTVTKKPRRS